MLDVTRFAQALAERGNAESSNTIAQFALDFPRKESVCGEHGRRA
jgi:hypothetical protein